MEIVGALRESSYTIKVHSKPLTYFLQVCPYPFHVITRLLSMGMFVTLVSLTAVIQWPPVLITGLVPSRKDFRQSYNKRN